MLLWPAVWARINLAIFMEMSPTKISDEPLTAVLGPCFELGILWKLFQRLTIKLTLKFIFDVWKSATQYIKRKEDKN
jgi:hypothetical protein